MAATNETIQLQRELLASINTTVDDETRDLVKAWSIAWSEISPDLTTVLAEVLATFDADRISRSQLQRSIRLQQALAIVKDRLENLADTAGVRILGDLQGVLDRAGGAQASIVDSQLPPDTDLVNLEAWSKVDARQLDAIVERITGRITSRLRPLSGEAYDAVRRELVRSVAAGSSPRVAARRMVARARSGFNGGLTRAMVIARTEMLDAHRTGAAVGQEQHTDVLEGWIWLASLRPRTCPACLSMHGRLFDLDVAGPEGHQQCRCTRMPKTKSWADLGFDDVDEPQPLIPDADDFFAGLTPVEQYEILGRKRYLAWQAGAYPREAWATLRTTDGWRDSWVVSPAPEVQTTTTSRTGGLAQVVDDGGPAMGRLVGTLEQQLYVRADPLKVGMPTAGVAREGTANHFHTYVPDPTDRTTALLQYFADTERMVKEIAADLAADRTRSRALSGRIGVLYRAMAGEPNTGVQAGGYTLADLKADLAGAAQRLLDTEPTPLGTVVYRGLAINGLYDVEDPDDVRSILARLQFDEWWYVSATPLRPIAQHYATRNLRRTPVILEMSDASGIVLASMGRMVLAPEVLLSGGVEVEAYAVEDGILVIRGRWRPWPSSSR